MSNKELKISRYLKGYVGDVDDDSVKQFISILEDSRLVDHTKGLLYTLHCYEFELSISEQNLMLALTNTERMVDTCIESFGECKGLQYLKDNGINPKDFILHPFKYKYYKEHQDDVFRFVIGIRYGVYKLRCKLYKQNIKEVYIKMYSLGDTYHYISVYVQNKYIRRKVRSGAFNNHSELNKFISEINKEIYLNRFMYTQSNKGIRNISHFIFNTFDNNFTYKYEKEHTCKF